MLSHPHSPCHTEEVKRNTLIALVCAGLLAGCAKKPAQDAEAVRRGVIEHVTKNAGLDVSNMDVAVSSVSFRENEANALVSFRPRSGGPNDAMQMNYTLQAEGDKWVVKGKPSMSGAPGGAGGHGGAGGGAIPPGHPAVPQGAPQK